MTDKQIIIDGVDVSGCCFYEKHYTEDEDVEIKHFCKIFHYHCETEPNCYYKQLKRKEQECERLKTELEQEKALKETYFACYKAKHEDIEGKLFKLSKTLTEIKEIAKGIAKSKYDSYPYGGDVETWEAQRAKQILQKISECEVE